MNTDLYQDGPPTDTDLDGLTDQGENILFFTDPNNQDSDGDGYFDGTEVLYQTNPLDPSDPAVAQTVTEPQSIPWSWYIARTSGITSYLLLFLLLIVGTGLTSGYIFKLFGPIVAWRIHRTTGITLLAFVAVHLVSLMMDKFIDFSLLDLLVPLHSNYNPTYLSMGIIGFYLLVIIILTSIFFIVTRYKAWRLLHYLTFPTFVLLFVHGLFIGSDSDTLTMKLIYLITGILVAIAFIYRFTKALYIKFHSLKK